MATLSEGVNIGDVVKYETPGFYCREKKTIKVDGAATVGLEIGQVLEDNTGLVPCTTGNNAQAILLEQVPLATLKAGASSAICLVRGPSIVDYDRLASGDKVAAVAKLLTLGIVSRTEPAKYEEGLATGL